ncbi:40933_t:CDS:2 [Gigaspora margarita]|uniref:40933_t:CDS:1 n=1 Tax=Gigaspora margarita TaxID=4874 RepID=A0ABN7WTD9_GIGMA|nr:40933_t:CDS:2 [Gigaspora margarita]
MVHWIDNKWQINKILLDICMLPHPHTGEEIDLQLRSVFVAFNITDKILCATTNSGSNITSAMQLLKKTFILQNHLFHFLPRYCLAHILNLIVTSGLSPIKASIEKVCNLVKTISSSLSLTQELKELRQSVGEGEAIQKISQDVSTCTYTMLDILILLIDDIVDTVLLYIQSLTGPEFLEVAATQMLDKIQKYTNEIYDKTAFIAAILDPQIKLDLIPDDINTEKNCVIFNNIFRMEYSALSFNNSSTNSELLNLTYTEKIAQKK